MRRNAASPGPVRLVSTETGAERISDTTMGASHQRNAGSSQATSPVQSTPSSICEPCRRSASPQGVALSARCGDFHCTDQPRNAAVTKTVWNSMRTGANSIENRVSRIIDSNRRIPPPYSREPWIQISTTLSSLGRNSSVSVAENSAIASCGCHCGHSGYSWLGCRKYSGTISVWIASSPVDSARKVNHSGADR